ncbi:MAG: hypothetical protein KIT14_00425 [bacterium]|nr:hypothetical protein [bacterium]
MRTLYLRVTGAGITPVTQRRPDASFGAGGLVTTTFPIGAAEGRSLALQPDGRIVVAGFAGFTGPDSDFVLAHCLGDPAPVCGNGTVESPEQCDDGNTVDGDCCSPTCTFDSAGAACAADADPCSTDACDGARACMHPSVAALNCRAPRLSVKGKGGALMLPALPLAADPRLVVQLRSSIGGCWGLDSPRRRATMGHASRPSRIDDHGGDRTRVLTAVCTAVSLEGVWPPAPSASPPTSPRTSSPRP